MTDKELDEEVRSVFEMHKKENRILPKSWLVQAVMLAHPSQDPWYSYCGYSTVGAAVRRVVNSIKANELNGDDP